MQPILKKLNASGSAQYYTEKWTSISEDHLEYLRQHSTTQRKDVPPDVQSRFKGDPITMFNSLGIQPQFHNLTMRLNGWTTPEDFDAHFAFLYVVNAETVDKLRSVSKLTT